MEHPDITFYNQKGMTRKEWQKEKGLDPQTSPEDFNLLKNRHFNYISTDKSLTQIINDFNDHKEQLLDYLDGYFNGSSMLLLDIDSNLVVQLFDVKDFLRASEGYSVKIEDVLDEDGSFAFRQAKFEAGNVEFAIFFIDSEEEEKLVGGLKR